MSYHLIVLCRRPPPPPPEGWPHTSEDVRFSASPAGEWTAVAAEHLGCDALAVIESSRDDSGSEAHMRSRCCALADAGDGVVLERVPMLAFPRYRVVYRGAPTVLGWDQLDAHIEARNAGGRLEAAAENARQQHEWQQRLAHETDKHVLFTELLRRAATRDRDLFERMEQPSWYDEVSVETLHHLLRTLPP